MWLQMHNVHSQFLEIHQSMSLINAHPVWILIHQSMTVANFGTVWIRVTSYITQARGVHRHLELHEIGVYF